MLAFIFILLVLLFIILSFYLSAERVEVILEQQPTKRQLDEEKMNTKVAREDTKGIFTTVFVEEVDETESVKISRTATEEQKLQMMNDEIKEEEQMSNFQADSLLQ